MDVALPGLLIILIPSVHNVFIVLTLASPLTTRIESPRISNSGNQIGGVENGINKFSRQKSGHAFAWLVVDSHRSPAAT